MLQDLIRLGLSDQEAKVYLAVLELGGSFVSAIARRARVNRSTCYHILDNLVKKGVLSSYQKEKVTYFRAEDPKRFKDLLEDKMACAEELIPQLVSLQSSYASKPKIRYYEGIEGIKSIFEDLLTTEGEILGYTNISDLIDLFPTYFKKYCHAKVKKGIKTRYIAPFNDKGVDVIDEYYPKNYDKRLVKILMVNASEFRFQNEIAIYGNKVAMISLNKDELIGLIVESKAIATSVKSFFDLAWLGATNFVT